MYYSGVNRGLYATAPGKYTTALIMILGLFAIASGYNAIYLSLSLGMAMIVISGIQSERIIRAHEVTEFKDAIGEAGLALDLELLVRNTSRHFPIYGIDILVPRLLKLPKKLDASTLSLGIARTLMLMPGKNEKTRLRLSGLPRGHYRRLPVIQKTVFPFGLIAKYKFAEVEGSLRILPAWDPVTENLLQENEARSFVAHFEPDSIHHHRGFTAREPLSFVDWRKSAGKNSEEWVVKVFETQENTARLIIAPDWLQGFSDSESFERFLSQVRTAVEVINRQTTNWEFISASGESLEGLPNVQDYLCALPDYAGFNPGRFAPKVGALILEINQNGLVWRRS